MSSTSTQRETTSCAKQLRAAAAREGRRLRAWDPQGKTIYNPYHRGSDTEIADKLLAAEVFTEPHYQRLAQRYIGHVVRALRLAGVPVSLATVVEHMNSGRLAALTRKMSPTDARPLLAYLETLTPQQERDLAGARDRLAILAESDVGHLLDPAAGDDVIDLRESLDRGDVVLFRLEADRRPLAAAMLGAAIVQDLVAISDERQHGEQRPGLIVIDEHSACGTPQTPRLFSRGRGAGLSQLVGTQEVADLGSADTDVPSRRRRDAAPDRREHRGAPVRSTEHARLGGAGGRDRRHSWRVDHHPADTRSSRGLY